MARRPVSSTAERRPPNVARTRRGTDFGRSRDSTPLLTHGSSREHMLGACCGVYQNVVDIHHYTLPVQVLENLLNKGLELMEHSSTRAA